MIIDKIIYGAGSGKLAIIITTDGYATAKKIDEETGRGATLIKAIGTYSGIERHLILCACGKAEIFKVATRPMQWTPTPLWMITEASEVFGEGHPAGAGSIARQKSIFWLRPCFRRVRPFVRHGESAGGGMPPVWLPRKSAEIVLQDLCADEPEFSLIDTIYGVRMKSV